MTKRILALLLVLTMLATAGCGGSTSTSTPQSEASGSEAGDPNEGRVLTLLTSADTESIDPTYCTATASWNHLMQVFEPLIYRDENMNLYGVLAESWEWQDELTLQLKLRQGVKFHSGAEFNADSVKLTFDRVMAAAGQTQNRAPKDIPYEDIEILDPYTCNIKLTSKCPMLPYYLRTLMMLDPTVYTDTEPMVDVSKVSGTGPYRMAAYTTAESMEFEAFEEYWGGEAKIKKAIFRLVPEASTRTAELLAGSADIIQGVSIDQLDTVETDTTHVISAGGGRDTGVAIRCDVEPFSDVRIRQAMNYAVDKEAINASLLGGYGEIYAGICMPPNENTTDITPYPYDPEKARTLLKEAGYETGLEVTITTSAGRYVRDKEISLAVAQYLEEVGIKASVEVADFSVITERKNNGTISNAFYFGLGGYFDGQGELNWANANIQQNGWEDEYFMSEYDALKQETDPEKRAKYIADLQVYVHEQAPWIFLFRQPLFYATANDVEMVARRDENFQLYYMSFI